jgi:hypothetical protein
VTTVRAALFVEPDSGIETALGTFTLATGMGLYFLRTRLPVAHGISYRNLSHSCRYRSRIHPEPHERLLRALKAIQVCEFMLLEAMQELNLRSSKAVGNPAL